MLSTITPTAFAPVLKGEPPRGEFKSMEADFQEAVANSIMDASVRGPWYVRTSPSCTCMIVGNPCTPNRRAADLYLLASIRATSTPRPASPAATSSKIGSSCLQ